MLVTNYRWVGAVYTAHMNVSVAALLGYLKGPEWWFDLGPYFCLAVLIVSAVIQVRCFFLFISVVCNRKMQSLPPCCVHFLRNERTMGQLSMINSGLQTEGPLTFVPIKCAFNVAQVSLASTSK